MKKLSIALLIILNFTLHGKSFKEQINEMQKSFTSDVVEKIDITESNKSIKVEVYFDSEEFYDNDNFTEKEIVINGLANYIKNLHYKTSRKQPSNIEIYFYDLQKNQVAVPTNHGTYELVKKKKQ